MYFVGKRTNQEKREEEASGKEGKEEKERQKQPSLPKTEAQRGANRLKMRIQLLAS